MGGLGARRQRECMGWTRAGHSQELTVSYTGCASFSLRHHSSRHILGVIWGLRLLHGLATNLATSLQAPQEA